MKKIMLASVALLISHAAYAADAVIEEPVPVLVEGFSWTGFYVGIHGGYSWADGEYSNSLAPIVSEQDLDGFLVGAHAGAQYQFSNNVVLGVEIDADYRDADGSGGFFAGGAPVVAGVTLDTEINWTGSARLRAGYAMDRWLPYVTGGFAFADYDLQIASLGVPIPTPGFSTSETSVGWTLGFGAEYAFTDNLLFRAEYRYSDFGDEDISLSFPVPFGSSYEIESHDVTIGISYKF
jgi:outer membrane immunogenic protein